MELETVDEEAMEVNITNEGNDILIHMQNDGEIKEEHLEQMTSYKFIDQDTEDHNETEEILEEELEITKLNNNKVTKKRVSLTIEKKIEIIQRHEKGETQRALSQEYNVGRTTISDILKRKYKFFKFMSMNADKEENLKRRRTLRRTVHKVLEDQLLEWYNSCREQGGYVSGPMISLKAQELHKELGYTDNFTASNGWLDRFKVRNGIKLCGLREVKTESDVNAVAPFKTELESLANWYNLTLDQIYNADEADLFWKMLPNPESDVNEVKSSVRAYRERMTVLCCSNATGSHKLPLVCVGRGKKSRTFTSHEVKTMPVNYYSQETAWMDQDIFREWFHQQYVPTVRQHLRYLGLPETALLLIDRSSSHPSDQFLRSDDGFFFCQYFPTKVKTLVQPMEQGIISNMKRYYRRDLLTELINKRLSLSYHQKTLSLKDAIRGIAQGWEAVTEDTIRTSFSKIFPATLENIQIESSVDPSISTEAFEKLLKQIPECEDYPLDRVEKWLNCDEAEPQKECYNPKQEEYQVQSDANDVNDDNFVFIELQPGSDASQTIEIIGTSSGLVDNNSGLIGHDSEEEIIEEEQEETVEAQDNLSSAKQPLDLNYSFEESSEPTCRQAFDALNVVLKFMKNDADSRYKDVIMLTELKKKLREKLNVTQPIKHEEIDYAFVK
jgi:DDE superfamily endonuclease/Tc5 transposase DNA-binding domain/CENP-B N-terminal DNA-binding domain